jgi:MGT family glycosyltransferase
VRVLAYTTPALGHLLPIVPVLQELRARSHDVAVRTLASRTGALTGLGLRAGPLDPRLEGLPLDDWRARSPLRAQARAMATFARRAPLDAADLQAAMDEEQPDLLLVDTMAFGAMGTAEASGLPFAAWLPYPAWVPAPGIPPYGPGLAPLGGPVGRTRDAAARLLGRPAGRALVRAVNAGRAAAGLAAVSRPEDVLLRPEAVLYLTSPPFEYDRPWPDAFHLVGPLSWEPPGALPAAVAQDPRPVVLVSTSTEFQDDARLAQTAFDALADRDDLLVVATVGAPDHGLTAPGNAVVVPFLPHRRLLDRAVAVVCHGGMGITQKSLAAGVPVCAVPFGRDQLEVARRLELCGAGTRLPAGRLQPGALRASVQEAVSRRAGARRVAAAFATAGGAPRAATVLEQLGR